MAGGGAATVWWGWWVVLGCWINKINSVLYGDIVEGSAGTLMELNGSGWSVVIIWYIRSGAGAADAVASADSPQTWIDLSLVIVEAFDNRQSIQSIQIMVHAIIVIWSWRKSMDSSIEPWISKTLSIPLSTVAIACFMNPVKAAELLALKMEFIPNRWRGGEQALPAIKLIQLGDNEMSELGVMQHPTHQTISLYWLRRIEFRSSVEVKLLRSY